MSRRAPDREAVVAPGAAGRWPRLRLAIQGEPPCLTTGMRSSIWKTSSNCRAPNYGHFGHKSSPRSHPPSLGRDILALGIAYARQERRYGGLSRPVAKELDRLLARALEDGKEPLVSTRPLPRAGTILVREWQGTTHHVTVTDDGFLWNGKPHRSL